ncbi:glycosyltransferase [Paraglaciecola aquimarina]|uniref:Glycosyltransferase n=1 Tax=Paraglaciecola algarum TaxID=3050085 RepID=A0ABS9D9M2_9ALTE|nr:glycosyltransferase family 2 protein [Paraglaciecola sp. G1-23]MCF2949655.1 glycosyltransferase [Paraglaciecola sp. G1-23]
MSKLPIISVVIPMYNVEKYIEQCIQSVLAQTFKNFEIICVDDGCTDNTLAKLNAFTDQRIKLVRQVNRGLSAARNTGISNSKGVYVALLDADDFWAKEKLSQHINHLNKNPEVGVSYCPSLFINEQGKKMGIGQFPRLKNVSAKHIFCRNPVGNGSAPVIRKRLLNEMTYETKDPKKANAKRQCVFDEDLRQSEDIELWTRIALTAKWKFEGINAPLTYYRVNEGGLSANLKKQYTSWCLAMAKNHQANPMFFKRYLSLARAYQLRYLARRAIRSGDSWQAIKLVHHALLIQPKIAIEEPSRTLITYVCALISILPRTLYKTLEIKAMQFIQQRSAT